jgi:hypothetical protein
MGTSMSSLMIPKEGNRILGEEGLYGHVTPLGQCPGLLSQVPYMIDFFFFFDLDATSIMEENPFGRTSDMD